MKSSFFEDPSFLKISGAFSSPERDLPQLVRSFAGHLMIMVCWFLSLPVSPFLGALCFLNCDATLAHLLGYQVFHWDALFFRRLLIIDLSFLILMRPRTSVPFSWIFAF